MPPTGADWIHEIKHDGFRILAHRRGRSVRLMTRNGRDFADRFPLVEAAIEALPSGSAAGDAFAERTQPVLAELANISATQAAAELNRRKIATAAGGKWYAATVIRLRERLNEGGKA